MGAVAGPALTLGAVSLLTGARFSASPSQIVAGFGLSVQIPSGWRGFAASGQLQAADFRLGRRALAASQRVPVARGRVHLIVWDYGRSVPYLARTIGSARVPLRLRRRDLGSGPLEGFPPGDVYAIRTVTLGGELLEVIADLGPKPFDANSLVHANRVLGTLRVQRPRLVRPRNRRLAAGGVALRLLPGWSGRIEAPAGPQAGQLVLRARRGRIRLVLIETPGGQGAHADLPITLATKNVLQQRGRAIACRVFSTAGRSFDLSALLPSRAALVQLNRLLQTLTAAPRPWTFRSCDLTLRLPGAWRAAVNPRSGCYPIITLDAPAPTLF